MNDDGGRKESRRIVEAMIGLADTIKLTGERMDVLMDYLTKMPDIKTVTLEGYTISTKTYFLLKALTHTINVGQLNRSP
jgi:hypothetical protein